MRQLMTVVLAIFFLVKPASWSLKPDAEIWGDFARWVDSLHRLPLGKSVKLRDLYIEQLAKNGLPRREAKRCLERIDVLRGESVEREEIYWNGKFKLNDSPEEPLPLLREAVRGLKPGKTLDVAMGNGRHGVYLASLGWEVTGYDVSLEALFAARERANCAGVKMHLIQATHDTFEFGNELWDLIVASYPYFDTLDAKWPPKLWRALKPGGMVVFQSTAPAGVSAVEIAILWKKFRLIRFEVVEGGEDWFAGQDVRTVKIIAYREHAAPPNGTF